MVRCCTFHPDMDFGPDESIFVNFHGCEYAPQCHLFRALQDWAVRLS
jgi:hypothetical protein